MKKTIIRYLPRVLALTMLCLSLLPAVAGLASGESLTVTPSVIQDSVAANSTKTYTVSITNGFALDIEVDGLGQSLDGATSGMQAAEDTSPLSARTWVTIDKTHLDAGTAKTLTVTATIPAGTTPGEKYAAIYMHSQPQSQGNASIISGIVIPVIFNVDYNNFAPNVSGRIDDLQIGTAYHGRPITVVTHFTNNGNTLLTGAQNKVTIKDSAQNIVSENTAPVSAPSVMPNYPRLVKTPCGTGPAPGNYTITSQITLTTGTVISQTANFPVVDPPQPPVAPTLVGPGSATAPGAVVNTLTPTFQWNAVTGANTYDLSVIRAPYTADDVMYIGSQLTGTSLAIPSGYLARGQKYRWQLTATNDGGTSSSSSFYFQLSGSSPDATTGGATQITATGATLNGTVTALGVDNNVAVSFEYGTGTDYGITTTPQTLTSPGPVSAIISNLTPDTDYHYRIGAVGSSTMYGVDHMFRTNPAPPPTTTAPPTTTTAPTKTTAPPTTTVPPTRSATPTPTGKVPVKEDFLPGVDESSVTYKNFTGETPYLNSTKETATEVKLVGSSHSTVTIATARYTAEPKTGVAFSGGATNGGTGKAAVKFIDVLVTGTSQGTARVTVHFDNSEIKDFDPSSLFLAYFSAGTWHRCSNISVSTADGTVSGDIPASRLTGTAVGLGGTATGAKSAALLGDNAGGVFVENPDVQEAGTSIPWSLVGIALVMMMVVGVIVLVVAKSRAGNPAGGSR